MGSSIYMALTGQEYKTVTKNRPKYTAWMSCHFSGFDDGLSNLPNKLDDDSILILDDSIPICDHSVKNISEQLQEILSENQVRGVLLDFQRPYSESLFYMTRTLQKALPCPVAAPPEYAAESPHPVFLPPVPHYQSVSSYLQKWEGREIWLEFSSACASYCLTTSGFYAAGDECTQSSKTFSCPSCHSHYHIHTLKDSAKFCFSRTVEDLQEMIRACSQWGVEVCIGLYQELEQLQNEGIFVHNTE